MIILFSPTILKTEKMEKQGNRTQKIFLLLKKQKKENKAMERKQKLQFFFWN